MSGRGATHFIALNLHRFFNREVHEGHEVSVILLGTHSPRLVIPSLRFNLGQIKLDLVIVRDTVIRMETVTISPKFQIVIPQRIREAMGLRSGEKARMLSFRNRIEVIPVRDIRSLRGYLKGIDTSFVRDGDRV